MLRERSHFPCLGNFHVRLTISAISASTRPSRWGRSGDECQLRLWGATDQDGDAAVSEKLRIFVSSVQYELEDERLLVQNLVNTDGFLSAHCLPVLYEFEPASPE